MKKLLLMIVILPIYAMEGEKQTPSLTDILALENRKVELKEKEVQALQRLVFLKELKWIKQNSDALKKAGATNCDQYLELSALAILKRHSNNKGKFEGLTERMI